MANPAPVISTVDRLCFTAFLAVAVHAVLILGLGFDFDPGRNETPVIEVTLASSPSETEPDQADYLAQHTQQGGGELDEKNLPTIENTAEFIEQQLQDIPQQSPSAQQQTASSDQTAQLITLGDSTKQVTDSNQTERTEDKLAEIDLELAMHWRNVNLTSPDAELDTETLLAHKKSRIKEVNSASTLTIKEAYYVRQWLDKIQRIGKQNYPAIAKRKKIFGNLRLTVILAPSGEVREIKLLRSSGHKILDDAAIRIVRLAEPFAPFPDTLKRDYDQLEITRTWLFSSDGQVPVLRGG